MKTPDDRADAVFFAAVIEITGERGILDSENPDRFFPFLSMSSRNLKFWPARYRSRANESDLAGFTLLEILIVVVFIGILAAIAFPNYLRWIDKTRYAQAATQMNCMAKEASIYKLETGTFPPDVLADIQPVGIDCFVRRNSGQIPFNSSYDYENWSASGGRRYIQISFFGKNGLRNSPTNTVVFSTPGIYEVNDDLLLVVGIF
jgi:prepilin-type N-terminal cleavage/methylation domain-containing protein